MNLRLRRRAAHFPGLHIHHDLKSEDYLIKNHGRALGVQAVNEFKPVKKSYRNWWLGNDQGQTPRCTAFGTLTNLACEPLRHTKHNPLLDPQKFYDEIRAVDHAEGRDFDEGATTLAAMKAAQARGFLTAYYWGYTIDILLRTLAVSGGRPIITGTVWKDSMFDTDKEGIVRVPKGARDAGGHLYTINRYIPGRELLGIEQTWGKLSWGHRQMYIPVEDYNTLLRDDGEFTYIDEVA